jgi:thiamine pyrophosphate-dependent acetolactate synthase large subunit-like protein
VHLHPDPAQVGRQLPTAVGLVATPATALRALAPHLDRVIVPAVTAARGERLAALRIERERKRQAERAGDAHPMPVEAVAAELNQVLPPEAVVVDEGGALVPGAAAPPRHRRRAVAAGRHGRGGPALTAGRA